MFAVLFQVLDWFCERHKVSRTCALGTGVLLPPKQSSLQVSRVKVLMSVAGDSLSTTLARNKVLYFKIDERRTIHAANI